MKEIWINLELNFKSYEFSIFLDFFGFFWIILRFFLMLKYELKNAKRVYFSRGATWMRHGNPGHVAAPRGPTRRLRGVIYIYYCYYI